MSAYDELNRRLLAAAGRAPAETPPRTATRAAGGLDGEERKPQRSRYYGLVAPEPLTFAERLQAVAAQRRAEGEWVADGTFRGRVL